MKNDKSKILLSVIIVNYNTSILLQSCLTSLFLSLEELELKNKTEIIVVDNASTDNSITLLKKNFPTVLIIQNTDNAGFAKANNYGITKSTGEYVLLLNTDARVSKTAVGKSLELLKQNKLIGVVAGKLVFSDGTLQKSAGFFPHLASVFNWMFFVDDIPLLNNIVKPYHAENSEFYAHSQKVDWVSGAYFMVRRDVVDRVGLLDESLFMYGEEVDWCYRIKKAGYDIYYDPSFQIIHDKGGSSRMGKNAGIIEEFKFIRFFFVKYHSYRQQVAVKIILKLGSKLRSILFGIIPKYRARKELYEKAFKLA